ncbi:hypothetical protein CIL03_05485 [Virgibacillus indicus]|uniref:YdhG-like domain-containing protein n=1 Tax=Virgibacillus indicus TaxID=2024554 RepID=A0A265NEX3_9BACI|nr:DUF1801 domain-containing protein [Virgibacillus indicus]OZU90592.1 hypothetical protein CIL03_05485 [Virgibacillus indicus]
MEPNKSQKVDQYVETLPENIREITTNLRGIIFVASDNIMEEMKWGMPSYNKSGNVCYLQPSKKHVNLGFYSGASLNDKDNLLEGTGKKMRHIRIKKLEEIQSEKFKALIQEAIELEAEQH